MLYIFNKTISNSNSILYALTVLYGIDIFKSREICKNVGINPQITINKLKSNHINRLIQYINKNLKIEQFLKKEKKDRLNTLLDIKSNRGIRLSLGLPVRGQRTHTNAKTVRKYRKVSIQKKLKQNKRPFKNKKTLKKK